MVGVVTGLGTNLIFGMMVDIDHTQLFSRRRKQLLAAILVFGGHLGFLREILTRFTKLALVLLILMLQTCYCT